MNTISVLIKPASSLCNLRCKYCFYYDVVEKRDIASTGVMSEDTVDMLIERIADYLGQKGSAAITFQGGEPMIAGLDYFRYFTAKLKEYPDIETFYFLQTNATLIDAEWASFFAENKFLIGVSFDGFQSNMDSYRYDPLHKSVYYKVLSVIDELRKAQVEFNIISVITSDLAKHPKALLNWYLEHRFHYVQLIPCLPGLDEEENSMSLTPKLYASFYRDFFSCWKKEAERGHYISVNLFENLAYIAKGMAPYQCGMTGRCSIQFIIESNGDVYPCDFYCLDEYRLGNLRSCSLLEMAENEKALSFLSESECRKTPCTSCPYVNICQGGCRRQNVCYLNNETCAYRDVLDTIMPVIRKMAIS